MTAPTLDREVARVEVTTTITRLGEVTRLSPASLVGFATFTNAFAEQARAARASIEHARRAFHEVDSSLFEFCVPSAEFTRDVPTWVAVDNGVAFLDERYGRANWIQRVNLASLDVQTQRDCVLGQVTGRTYVEALDVVGAPDGGGLRRTIWTDEHGFSRDLVSDEVPFARYRQLTAAWVTKIEQLRAEVSA